MNTIFKVKINNETEIEMTSSAIKKLYRENRNEIVARIWLYAHNKQYFTQEALAGEIGVSREYLCYVLNGKKLPSPDLLRRIADVIGCELSHLLGLTSDHTEHARKNTADFLEAYLGSLGVEFDNEKTAYMRDNYGTKYILNDLDYTLLKEHINEVVKSILEYSFACSPQYKLTRDRLKKISE